MPPQEIQLFPIPQTCALIALGIREAFVRLLIIAHQCLSVDITEGIPKQGVYSISSPPSEVRFSNSLLSHSIGVVLPKLRALPCTPGPMDDCAAGVSRAPRHLPQETQRPKYGTAHGRALYLDGTPLEASEGVIDRTKGGSSHLT